MGMRVTTTRGKRAAYGLEVKELETPAQQSVGAATSSRPVGPRSEVAAAEVRELEKARASVSKEVGRLAKEIAGRQETLDGLRAEGLLGRVDKDQVAAFEVELATLESKLDEARSALAGLDRLLNDKRQELEAAKVAGARAALKTDEFSAIQDAMSANAEAMTKARAGFLEALKSGAAELIETAKPRWDEWHELLDERRGLYHKRVQVTGGVSDPDRQLLVDPLSKLFADDYAVAEVLSVVEMLLPLIVISFGWPAVRRPRR